MPEDIWFYLIVLLYYSTSGGCVMLAEALETVSQDRLTRLLQATWSGQTPLELSFRTLFVLKRSYLILDDEVIPKPFAKVMEGLPWVYATQDRKPVFGGAVGRLVWTDGKIRIPLGFKF